MDHGTQGALKKKLIEIIRAKSYREGNFQLASGKKSKFYVDLKTTTLDPDGAYLIGKLAVDLIESKSITIDAVGGLTLGADPIATAISLAARERGLFWPAFIVRKESKSHGTSRYIENVEALKPGARVLVLEDVVTTGGSSLKAIARLRDAGFEPVVTLTVVDREEGGAKFIAEQGMKFFSLATLSEIRG